MPPFSLPPARRTRQALRTVAAVSALTAALTACSSSDDKDADASDGPKQTASEATLTAEQQAACDGLLDAAGAMLTLSAGESEEGPSDAQLTEVADLYGTLQAGLTGEEQTAAGRVADTLREVVETQNRALLEDEAFFTSLQAPAAAGRELCGYDAVDVMAHETPAATADGDPEMSFMGLPETLPAGPLSLGLTNDAENFHEAAVMKVKDSFTGTLEDWKKLDEKAAQEAAEIVGVTLAPPQASGFVNLDLAPGRYFVICHVPLMDGAGPDAQPKMGENGPIWHYSLGMASEVTVS